MGTYMKNVVQELTSEGWMDVYEVEVDQCYTLYGWLADVRNYSAVPVLHERRGWPEDFDPDDRWYDVHSPSWYLLSTLLKFDYDQTFEDRRVTRQIGPNSWDGGITGEPGEGEITTYRKAFPRSWFKALEEMKEIGNPDLVRFVFAFSS